MVKRSVFLFGLVAVVVVGDSSNMRMSRIRFEAGARTNWHLHSTVRLQPEATGDLKK